MGERESQTDARTEDDLATRVEKLEERLGTVERDNDQLRSVLRAVGRLFADRDLLVSAESCTAPS